MFTRRLFPRHSRATWLSTSKLFLSTLMIAAAGVCLAAATAGGEKSSSAAQAGGERTQAQVVAPGTPRFTNYYAPAGMAEDVAEPTCGVNWNTEQKFSNSMFEIPNGGRVMLYGGFSTDLFRITFSDCSTPAKALWEAKPLLLAAAPRAAGDPIMFTDEITGRTFVSQLVGLTPAGSTTDITDNDGDTFAPSEGSSLPSDVDHQTYGGGPFAFPPPPGAGLTGYPHAVYYASQSVGEARTAVSLDGGFTFGPAFPMYTVDQCSGLHGHIQVSPKDGTVYVPNRGCGGSVPFHEVGARQAVIVSEDNGITWAIRPIPDATTHGNGDLINQILGTRDPAAAVDADGTVYFVYQGEDRETPVTDPENDLAGDTHPKVAVSRDKGLTWEPSIDVGANVINGGPIRNATFVTAVAGGPGRAAVAFYGTETGGNNWACGTGNDCAISEQGVSTGIGKRPLFEGVWYLYVSVTYDGGKTWTTQNVTPGDPIQRGGICGGGTCRNLLDFMDIEVDKEGRIIVAGQDGCIGGCVQGGANSFTAKGFITRQSGGKRLFAEFDPVEPALPGAPNVSAAINSAKNQVTLTWPEVDAGGSVISGYKIYRRAGESGAFTLLANIPETTFSDTSFDPNATNYYRVTAVNGIGEGPFCDEILPVPAPELETPCVLPGVTVLTDPANDIVIETGVTTNPAYDLRSLSVAEPIEAGDKMVFTIKVESLAIVPPNTRWPLQFRNIADPADVGRFVDMRSDAAGQVSFKYGTFVVTDGAYGSPNAAPTGDADAESNFRADGTITLVLSRDKVGNPLPTGRLEGFLIRVRIDPAGITPDNMGGGSGINPTGSYDVVGNAFCAANTPPLAVLNATPIQGNTPLTVNFTGAGSSDVDAGDTVASYRFNFGDGTPEVTQPEPTISHTYNRAGVFFATLKVVDSRGKLSANIANVVIKTPAALQNISTRERVQAGDDVAIGGFIISGTAPKKVIIRGIGPSLSADGEPLNGRLEDPTLELFDQSTSIAFNDNWKESQEQDVVQSGIPPIDDKEAAIVRTLAPGQYTAVLRGKNETSGIGLVEIYDIERDSASRLANLSTRGIVQTGNSVLIGGFILGPAPAGPGRIVVRALGPSFKDQLASALDDPTLELRNPNGEIVAQNDNWADAQQADLQATGLAPANDAESAIYFPALEPNSYTAIVRGKNNNFGLGLVEIYQLQ